MKLLREALASNNFDTFKAKQHGYHPALQVEKFRNMKPIQHESVAITGGHLVPIVVPLVSLADKQHLSTVRAYS